MSISLNATIPFSIDAWIRFDGLSAYAAALSQDGEFAFGSIGDSIFFTVAGVGTVVSDRAKSMLVQGHWHNICVTFDTTTLRLYIDGFFNSAHTSPGFGTATANPYVIGQGVQGLVRRVRVYNTALTAKAVLANMFGVPAPEWVAACFDFSRVPPVDSGPAALPITLQGNAQMVRASPALSLGTEGFARPFEDMEVNPGGAQVDPYSVQSWICLAPSTAPQQAIFVNSDLESDAGIALYLQYDSTACAYRLVSQRGSNSEAKGETLVSRGTIAPRVWTNVATTFDGAVLTLYLDGTLDSSMACAPIPLYRPQSDLLIGAAIAQGMPSGATTLQGFIREVDVWSCCLTPEQIAQYRDGPPDPAAEGIAAAYDFTSSPARNQANGRPIGLAEGAMLSAQIESTLAPELEPEEEAPAAAEAKLVAGFRESLDFGSLVREQRAIFEQAIASDVASFESEADRDLVMRRWDEALARLQDDPASLPLVTSWHSVNGERLLVCHTPQRSYVGLRLAEGTFDECTLWRIHLVFVLVAGTLAAFTGVGARLNDEASKYILTILANPRIAAELANGREMTATAVLAILSLIYQGGFLRPLIGMIVEVGFWSLFRVAAKMVAVAMGVGAAEAVASLAATAAIFILAYRARPESCDPLPAVTLASIAFDWDPTNMAVDALAIRKDFATQVAVPEWTAGKVLASASPAAYAIDAVAGHAITIRVALAISAPTGRTVRIRATGGGILGAVDPVPVVFDQANNATVTLNLPNHQLAGGAGVRVQDIQWVWEYQVGSSAWTAITTTDHRIYALLTRPTLPWTQGANRADTQLPWTDVLDYSCVWANGATTALQAQTMITQRVNGGLHLTYDNVHGASAYTDEMVIPETFLCTSFIAYLGGVGGNGMVVNCMDCAAIVTAFANILGCDLFAAIMRSPASFKCNQIIAIGANVWGCPFPPGNQFSYHEVAWTGAGGYLDAVYDACLQLDTDNDPWTQAPPHAAGLPANYQFTTMGIAPVLPIATPFNAISYRERLAQNNAQGIGRCVPRGPWPNTNAGRRPVR